MSCNVQDLKFVDSMDQTHNCGAWSYLDIANPVKGQEGYPRLLIENRAYCSRVFRKLHIELAHRQDGMQVTFWEHIDRVRRIHACSLFLVVGRPDLYRRSIAWLHKVSAFCR